MKTILVTLSVFIALTIASSDCYGQKNDTTHVVKKDKMKLLVMPSSPSTEAVANSKSKEQKGTTAPPQQPVQPPANGVQKSGEAKKKN